MPLKYICSKCRAIIYYYDNKKSKLYDQEPVKLNYTLTPLEVCLIYNGKCPNCQNALNPTTIKNWIYHVKVKSNDHKRNIYS